MREYFEWHGQYGIGFISYSKSSDDESKKTRIEKELLIDEHCDCIQTAEKSKRKEERKKEKCYYHTLFIWVGIDYNRGSKKALHIVNINSIMIKSSFHIKSNKKDRAI